MGTTQQSLCFAIQTSGPDYSTISPRPAVALSGFWVQPKTSKEPWTPRAIFSYCRRALKCKCAWRCPGVADLTTHQSQASMERVRKHSHEQSVDIRLSSVVRCVANGTPWMRLAPLR